MANVEGEGRHLRLQHPPFLRTVLADARATMTYRGEGRELTKPVDAVLQIMRLVWVSDAFLAQICYRAKARLQTLGVPILPRVFHRLAMTTAQVCIGDPVVIEPGLYLPHGQVVIDGFVRIGSGAILFPWVTIGLIAGNYQGPTLEADVHVGTGAKLIGPVTIGTGVRIGANAVVLNDVPAGSTMVGVPASVARPASNAPTDEQPDPAVEKLIASGRLKEAIDALTDQNRRVPSVRIERRLVQLRHDAFFATTHDIPEGSWPPPTQDRFGGLDGIPEINAVDLSAVTLRAGILGHGSLIVRGLLDLNRCNQLRESIPLSLAACADLVNGATDAKNSPWYWPLQVKAGLELEEEREFIDGVGVLAADAPRLLFDLLEAVESTNVPQVLTAYFGERPALSVKKTTLREVPPDTGGLWHQDGAFLGEGIRSVNVWIALSPCGTDAASLDIVPRRLDHIVTTGTEGAIFDWAVSDQFAETAANGREIVRPIFEPGDAILFDEMNLHRTGAGPGLTKPRYAVEMWFFAPSTYPMAQIPLLL